jgi:hypothetical protein
MLVREKRTATTGGDVAAQLKTQGRPMESREKDYNKENATNRANRLNRCCGAAS